MSAGPTRPRRLRTTPAMRDLVADVRLHPSNLVWPTFVLPGEGRTEPVASLPGVQRYSVDRLLPELERAHAAGVRAAMLFGVVGADAKDPHGTAAANPDGPVPRALRAARAAFGDDLVLMSDVCLCGYTDHGHCGVLAPPRPGAGVAQVANDATLPRLAEMAVRHAEAGADVVAPSDMMDGRVAAIRAGLDAAGFDATAILSYAVKYASAFYGPFREAAGSAPQGTLDGPPAPHDRRTYQMDPAASRAADVEVALDAAEGADLLMVKPAGPYLDVIRRVRDATSRPVAAYQVSGEYAMLEAAIRAGVLEREPALTESLLALRRAGADLILSYHAVAAAEGGWGA
ncbi:MAG: porphobilinogen synthase [Trueperaceae bacterium]|nr:porphobilinogen synthase [Trueperaceae bacterium]